MIAAIRGIAGGAIMKTIPVKEQTERRLPIEILELDPPFEDDFLPANFPFMTGEPGLGRNNDIVGIKSSRYVSSNILGRLP
jgi:hypothetical protein